MLLRQFLEDRNLCVRLGQCGGVRWLLLWALVSTSPGGLSGRDCDGDGQPDDSPVGYPVRKVIPPSGYLGDFAALDFNADGWLDLAMVWRAVSVNAAGEAGILYGTEHGGFGPRVSHRTGMNPSTLTTADFDQNGRMDIAVANAFSDDITMLMSTLEGSLVSRGEFPAGCDSPNALHAADLDADGDMDLLCLGERTNVSIVLNDGSGALAQPRVWAIESTAIGAAIIDLEGDGRLDVGLTLAGSSDLHGYTVDTNGAVSPMTYRLVVGPGPGELLAADFDASGRADLAVSNWPPGRVSVFLAGAGISWSAPEELPTEARPRQLISEDFNQDSIADLLVAIPSTAAVLFLAGRGDGTFDSARSSRVAGIGGPLGVGDFNRDQVLDIAVVDFGLAIYTGDEEGLFRGAEHVSVDATVGKLFAADLDADGHDEVISMSIGVPRVSVLAGGAGLPPVKLDELLVGEDTRALVVADLSGDGVLDIATANFGSSDLSTVTGRGDATFHSDRRTAAVTSPTALAAADFDLDGRLDLATVAFPSRDLLVLLGTGDGLFSPPRRVDATGALVLIAADFNEDGIVDHASGDIGGRTTLSLAQEPLRYSPPVLLGQDGFPTDLVAVDFQGDGTMDLAGLSDWVNELRIWVGVGGGIMERQPGLAIESSASLLAEDVNADGSVDLLWSSRFSNSVSILLGHGDDHFARELRHAVREPLSLAVHDWNLDGLPDLTVATNDEDRALSVLFNQGFSDVDLPPALRHPGTLVVPCASAEGAVVMWQLEARDDCDPSPTITCDVDSGEVFPVGRTVVTCRAQDVQGHQSVQRFEVVVVDDEPPIITCSVDLEVQCRGPAGSQVAFTVEAEDSCDPTPVIECDHPSPSMFRAGDTLVTCTASDSRGNRASCSFHIRVKDCGGLQIPGDCNQDGMLDISDGICLLGNLFLGSPATLPCDDGTLLDPENVALLDSNGDARVDLSDAVRLFGYLFSDSSPPVLGVDCMPIEGCPDNSVKCSM